MQPKSIAPRWRRTEIAASVLTAATLLIGAVGPAGGRQTADVQATAAADGIGGSITNYGHWIESPAHVRLFAPPAHQSEYRAFVSTATLDNVLRRLVATQPGPPGAWHADSVSPLDAFGASGTYNRFQLSRLYLGQRPRTARGPWVTADGLESWTLVSPYPKAGLDDVEPGILLIALRVPPL